MPATWLPKHLFKQRCRSRKICGGAKDFYQNFPKLARKVFVRLLPRIFSYNDHEDIFLVWPPQKVFVCFFANVVRHLLKSTTLGAIFARIFRNFAQIFSNFARNFDKSKLFGLACTRLLQHCVQARAARKQYWCGSPV